jgi:hypothetical protein
MSLATEETKPMTPPPFRLRFRLVHVFYVMALIGSALATFGSAGIMVAIVILAICCSVVVGASRPRGLVEGCLGPFIGFCLACLLSLLLPVVATYRDAPRREWCMNNLKQIAIGLQNYHDVYKSFPPSFIADGHGKPKHSWRVLLLPFIEQQALYDAYDFDEPWNGPNNAKLLKQMPSVYACPIQAQSTRRRSIQAQSARRRSICTSYVAVVGPRTPWPRPQAGKLSEIPDGISNTILVLEDNSSSISWMEPRDLEFDQAIRLLTSPDPVAAGLHRHEDFFCESYDGRDVAMADGRVRFLQHGIGKTVWSAPLQIDDGVRLSDSAFNVPSARQLKLKLGNCFRLAVFLLLTLFPLPWVFIKRARSPEPAKDA